MMKEITVEALLGNFSKVQNFVNEELENLGCKMKTQFQIEVSVEEIFINIANYAYPEKTGNAKIQVLSSHAPLSITIKFIDTGLKYNPLEKEDPDVTLSAEERKIGGLGIYMVKKYMDDISYEYKNNCNILSITKKL